MIERIQQDRLLLHRDALDALAFGVIAGEGDAFGIVPKNISLVCELLYQGFPCQLSGIKVDVRRA